MSDRTLDLKALYQQVNAGPDDVDGRVRWERFRAVCDTAIALTKSAAESRPTPGSDTKLPNDAVEVVEALIKKIEGQSVIKNLTFSEELTVLFALRHYLVKCHEYCRAAAPASVGAGTPTQEYDGSLDGFRLWLEEQIASCNRELNSRTNDGETKRRFAAQHGAFATTLAAYDESAVAPVPPVECDCQCCDHSEGTDCACECHATGKCAAPVPPRGAPTQDECNNWTTIWSGVCSRGTKGCSLSHDAAAPLGAPEPPASVRRHCADHADFDHLCHACYEKEMPVFDKAKYYAESQAAAPASEGLVERLHTAKIALLRRHLEQPDYSIMSQLITDAIAALTPTPAGPWTPMDQQHWPKQPGNYLVFDGHDQYVAYWAVDSTTKPGTVHWVGFVPHRQECTITHLMPLPADPERTR